METNEQNTEQKTETIQPAVVNQVINAPATRQSVELSNGVVTPKTIDEAYRYAVAVHKSGLAPKQFDSAEKVMIAMQTASELGLPPMTSLKSMYVVNGTVALFGDLPLALVRKSGHLEYIIEEQFDTSGKLMKRENNNLDAECAVAICKTKRKGEPEVVREFSWAEAIKAGLDKDKWGDKATYKNFRRRMLQMRARSWNLKDTFSDVLLGIAIEEYDNFNEKDVTPKAKASINDILTENGVQNESI